MICEESCGFFLPRIFILRSVKNSVVVCPPPYKSHLPVKNLVGKRGEDNSPPWHFFCPDLQDSGNKACDLVFFLFVPLPCSLQEQLLKVYRKWKTVQRKSEGEVTLN